MPWLTSFACPHGHCTATHYRVGKQTFTTLRSLEDYLNKRCATSSIACLRGTCEDGVHVYHMGHLLIGVHDHDLLRGTQSIMPCQATGGPCDVHDSDGWRCRVMHQLKLNHADEGF